MRNKYPGIFSLNNEGYEMGDSDGDKQWRQTSLRKKKFMMMKYKYIYYQFQLKFLFDLEGYFFFFILTDQKNKI